MDAYDFVVVGAGSAGCVVASRLSENPDARVLVLEAGGMEFPPNVEKPWLWFTLIGSSIDWGYLTVRQPALGNRRVYMPRGKLPGGSSNMHIMMHIRGHQSDFDGWAYDGCPGWSYRDVLPFFRKLEGQEDDTNPSAGKEGPLFISNAGAHEPHPTSHAFIAACRELGHPATPDFNGEQMEGVGWHHIYVKQGVRQSAWVSHLKPAASRPNLTLLTGAHASRLVFEGTRCVGVAYVQGGAEHLVRANHEVVVCLGAIESPKLLLLSGIGAHEQLERFDIPTVADLPGVGENFHDHVLTGLVCGAKKPMPPGKQNLSEAALFTRSGAGRIGPDLQLGFVHVPFDIIVGQKNPDSFSILPGLVRPLSRGWIRLGSRNALDQPLIHPNYMSVQADRDRMVECLRLARGIFRAKAFAEWAGEELLPGPECQTAADLNAYVSQRADSYHHQAGSCKMGLDALAVVDPELRVHGVEGLRVADASVMPAVPSGNCNAAIMMIGERCAALIKNANGMQN